MTPRPADGHTWTTVSRHATAAGTVTYQRCPCGGWRTLQGPEVVAGPADPSRCGRLSVVGRAP